MQPEASSAQMVNLLVLNLQKNWCQWNIWCQRKATVAIVSGRQPGLVGGTDTIRVRTI
ncbi:MAG: hypothetical protein HXL38_03275 [Candidatus Saccharimonas sp.]|nr:MAG: hypothetical protein HXL38_03275 [Candidatus Saccharimonas sp.]